MGKGEEGPLCDPGSESLLGGRESESSARIIKGTKEKRKEERKKIRNLDPGSQSRLFSLLPTTVRAFCFISKIFQPFLQFVSINVCLLCRYCVDPEIATN